MKALIDADNIAFACGASAEDEPVAVAIHRTNEMIEGILADVGADEYELWLSGPTNFRYRAYPEYKANRLDSYRPKWEKVIKAWMVDEWQANYSDGCEADDMLGVRQCESQDTIICHLDKDINQIPGEHFNWEMRRLGEIIRPKQRYTISDTEGARFFFYQLLVGDVTDNIKGVRGIGPKKANELLNSVPAADWYDTIKDLFSCEEELELNAACVYIWRKQNDNWKTILQSLKGGQPPK